MLPNSSTKVILNCEISLNRRLLLIFFLLVFTLTGCSTLSWYGQSISGHFKIINKRQKIESLLSSTTTSPRLTQKLIYVQSLLNFAATKMGLAHNGSYQHYVKLKSDYPVWNVMAAPKLSLDSQQWCYLIVGCVSYRGYFSVEAASKFAEKLKAQGYDVLMSPAVAYSTLGWFNDPLLSSMTAYSDPQLAALLFHELAHQQLYIKNDTEFNESFAAAVEELATEQWLIHSGKREQLQHWRTNKIHRQDMRHLLLSTRISLEIVYKSTNTDAVKLSAKKRLFAKLRTDYDVLRKKWKQTSGFNQWFYKQNNNAALSLVADYQQGIPAFLRLFNNNNANWQDFFTAVEHLSQQDEEVRMSFLSSQ